MGINRDFRDLLAELFGREARFLVVGAHAVIFHTTPRYTKDLDIWIEPTDENAARVYEALALERDRGFPPSGLGQEDSKS
jgi:hypothetical protein